MDELDNAAQQTPEETDQSSKPYSASSVSKLQTMPLQTDQRSSGTVTPLTRHIYEFIEKEDYHQVSRSLKANDE